MVIISGYVGLSSRVFSVDLLLNHLCVALFQPIFLACMFEVGIVQSTQVDGTAASQPSVIEAEESRSVSTHKDPKRN